MNINQNKDEDKNKRYEEINNIFNNLNTIIEKQISKKDAEKELIEIYSYFCKQLKLIKGTSSNFTGLSEYLFFN